MTDLLAERDLRFRQDVNEAFVQMIMDTAVPLLTAKHTERSSLPPRVEEKLDALAQVPVNWDSYGGDAVMPEVVASAHGLLQLLFSTRSLPDPQLSPTRNGGVLIEWSSGPHELEVELVSPDAFSFVYSNAQSGLEYEGEAFRDELLDDRFLRCLNYMS